MTTPHWDLGVDHGLVEGDMVYLRGADEQVIAVNMAHVATVEGVLGGLEGTELVLLTLSSGFEVRLAGTMEQWLEWSGVQMGVK